MAITLPSVLAFAQLDLTEESAKSLQALLDQETDWQEWLNQLELHGLSGLANKLIVDHSLHIPQQVAIALKALKVRHTSAARARHKTLAEIAEVFAANNIPWLALKGAALLPHFYKDAYLRPMRDLDLLVPQPRLLDAAKCLRSIDYDLPDKHPSKYMRDMHQLPNASKMVDGLYSSVELHHDAFSRELKGHLFFPKDSAEIQLIEWDGLSVPAFEDLTMLHQVCRHMEGLHSNALLKLINVVDVIGFAQFILRNNRWHELELRYPHVINSLRCLHFLTPLPKDLQEACKPLAKRTPQGVGVIMGSIRDSYKHGNTSLERLKPIFLPSDWWMYLYYNRNPDTSLLWTKLIRHPLRMSTWLLRKLHSRLLGG